MYLPQGTIAPAVEEVPTFLLPREKLDDRTALAIWGKEPYNTNKEITQQTR